MLHDLRYGIRMLLKSPGFTVATLVALAVGIGATTAMFTAIDAWRHLTGLAARFRPPTRVPTLPPPTPDVRGY